MKKLWALHGLRTGILVAVLAVAVVGVGAVTAIKAPSAHAAIVGGGGCSYYYDTESYGKIWNTNLCVDGPYYNSSGTKYFTWQASCWVNSDASQQANGVGWVYNLGCTAQDSTNSILKAMSTRSGTYYNYNTPSVVLSLSTPRYTTTRLPTDLDIWINGYSYLLQIGYGVFNAPPVGVADSSYYDL